MEDGGCLIPTYSFSCISKSHPSGKDRAFIRIIHHGEKKRIDQCTCNVCGGLAKRDFTKDFASVNMTGSTPISHATTVKGSVANTIEFVAGQFKENPDGSKDRNHRPFRDTGELNKFLNGNNNMGDPVLNDHGQPIRRKDGSIVRKGAKLFKYGANATPSRDGIRTHKPRLLPNSGWVSETGVVGGGGSAPQLKGTPTYKSPKRGRG